MKCCNCLHKGTQDDPVSIHSTKDGKPIALCDHETDCWARWDKAHGFATPAIKEYAKRELVEVK